MSEGDVVGRSPMITSLAPPGDVARAFARCLPALRSQMRLLRWLSVGLLALLAIVFPPANPANLLVLVAGAALLVWLTSLDGVTRYYVLVVRKTPSLTIPQTVTSEPGGLHFLDHESDRRYAWHRWESVDDVPEGIALVLRGGWQADLLHVSAFTSPEHRAEWLAAIRRGISAVQPAR
jgi:hypothetical protein